MPTTCWSHSQNDCKGQSYLLQKPPTLREARFSSSPMGQCAGVWDSTCPVARLQVIMISLNLCSSLKSLSSRASNKNAASPPPMSMMQAAQEAPCDDQRHA